MKRLLFLILLASMGINRAAAEMGTGRDTLWTLDRIPQWIQDNIYFPQGTSSIGMAGVEKFVISAAWDGRVYISSPLNTLHPAYEKVIKDVVSRAPRCRFAGVMPQDMYKLVQIDFAAFIPSSLRDSLSCLSAYRFPRFVRKGERVRPLDDDRERFIAWLSKKFVHFLANGSKGYKDTVLLSYTIGPEGKIAKASVADCENTDISKALERAVLKSPVWLPAVAQNGLAIAIEICDRIIIDNSFSAQGPSLRLSRDLVCCNASNAPSDPDMIVLNPSIPPYFEDDYRSLEALIRESLTVDDRVRYVGYFVVEKDGTATNVYVDGSNSHVDSVITNLICRSNWVPARQGNKAVRSLYTFQGEKLPPMRYAYAPHDTYPRFLSAGWRPAYAYDPPYDQGQRRRWRRFCAAYPDASANPYGYAIFRKLDVDSYNEALIIRGVSPQNTQKRIVRNKK